MPLPSSGRISADLIRTEYGKSGQRIAIGDYVRGGSNVPNLPANANISLTKSNLRWSHFYGSATSPPIPTITGARFGFPTVQWWSGPSLPRAIPFNLYNAAGYLTSWPVIPDSYSYNGGGWGYIVTLQSFAWNGTKYICTIEVHDWASGDYGGSDTRVQYFGGPRPASIPTGVYYPWDVTSWTDDGGYGSNYGGGDNWSEHGQLRFYSS